MLPAASCLLAPAAAADAPPPAADDAAPAAADAALGGGGGGKRLFGVSLPSRLDSSANIDAGIQQGGAGATTTRSLHRPSNAATRCSGRGDPIKQLQLRLHSAC